MVVLIFYSLVSREVLWNWEVGKGKGTGQGLNLCVVFAMVKIETASAL